MSKDTHELPPSSTRSGRRRASSFKAVSIGLLVDVVGTLLVALVATFGYFGYLAFQGLSADEMQQVVDGMGLYHPLSIASTLAGIGCSFLGGYFCASLTPQRSYRDPLMLMALSNGCALLLTSAHFSVVENLGMLIVGCAATLGGAHFKFRDGGAAGVGGLA